MLDKGQTMYNWIRDLFPINRSITGDGVRETLFYLKKIVPIKIKSVPTGYKAYDWTVPNEWKVKEAFIKDDQNKTIIDFKNNNLHLVSYSTAINKTLTFKELKNHLHTLPKQPNAIPYVTSYYKKNWGFCLEFNKYKKLDKSKKYKVFINSSLKKGKLNYGEIIIKGKVKKEIFISTYVCHPSMANNELSGPVLATMIAKILLSQNNYFSYRIIYVPETIGSLVYLSKNFKKLKKNTVAGFNLTCVGDSKKFSFLPSRNGNTLADESSIYILKKYVKKFILYNWLNRGSDERQYCSPGFDLPVVNVMRSKHGTYREYHTSLDNLDFVSKKGLQESLEIHLKIFKFIESNLFYKSNILGEPFLSKHNLHDSLNKNQNHYLLRKKILDFLSYADGRKSLLEISAIINVPFEKNCRYTFQEKNH